MLEHVKRTKQKDPKLWWTCKNIWNRWNFLQPKKQSCQASAYSEASLGCLVSLSCLALLRCNKWNFLNICLIFQLNCRISFHFSCLLSVVVSLILSISCTASWASSWPCLLIHLRFALVFRDCPNPNRQQDMLIPHHHIKYNKLIP